MQATVDVELTRLPPSWDGRLNAKLDLSEERYPVPTPVLSRHHGNFILHVDRMVDTDGSSNGEAE